MCLELNDELESVSRPKLKYVKMRVHAPSAASAKLNKALLQRYIAVAGSENTNFIT